MLSKLHNADWPVPAWSIALLLGSGITSTVVRVVWARHKRRQQVATVDAIVTRWIKEMERPFDEMSAQEQLSRIARLDAVMVGNPVVVVHYLLMIRVSMESIAVDERVLVALDRLTQQWHDRSPSHRKRRERRLHALADRDVDRLVSRASRDAGKRAARP